MRKYKIETILNYINGYDIKDYNIGDLEDDFIFMEKVINYTNDKNIYNLCSDKVKTNYNFVKFIIKKFKNDLNFIFNVADYFLNNNKDEVKEIELNIIMYNLSKNKIKGFNKYKILTDSTYAAKRVELEMIKQKYLNKEDIKETQMGFWFIIEDYNFNKTILNFYAQKFIETIFKEEISNLEEYLHKQFQKYEELEKMGINNYLINVINKYDSYLSYYISCNLFLLDEIKVRLNNIRIKWDFYNHKKEFEIYNGILDKVYEYIDKHNNEFDFDYTEMIYLIANELGILKKLHYYDCRYTDGEEIINNINIKRNFTNNKHYLEIKKIMLKHLKDDININNSDNKKSKGLIIDFRKHI